ncbi:class I SAM-dependent methyltransferase [Vibrio paucivorans]
MHLFDRFKVYLYHRNRIKTWSGNLTKIQGWSSEHAQQVRFDVIRGAADFNGKHVVDLGCGYGELFDFLSERDQLAKYTGVEQQRQFLKSAKQRLSDKLDICRFVCADLSKFSHDNVDVVVACGSLNYKSRDSEYLTSMVAHMYNMAGEAVIFNLLDSATFPKQNLVTGYNKQGVYLYCKTLCESVELIDGYADDDFTIVMRK